MLADVEGQLEDRIKSCEAASDTIAQLKASLHLEKEGSERQKQAMASLREELKAAQSESEMLGEVKVKLEGRIMSLETSLKSKSLEILSLHAACEAKDEELKGLLSAEGNLSTTAAELRTQLSHLRGANKRAEDEANALRLELSVAAAEARTARDTEVSLKTQLVEESTRKTEALKQLSELEKKLNTLTSVRHIYIWIWIYMNHVRHCVCRH